MNNRFDIRAILASIALVALLPASASASSHDFAPYVVIEQDLRTALDEIGSLSGESFKVDGSVEGQFRERVSFSSLGDFIHYIEAEFGVFCYDDGLIYHVVSADDVIDELVSLGHLSYNEMATVLSSHGLLDERFPINLVDETNVFSISGPKAYVERVRGFVQALNEASKPAPVTVTHGRRLVNTGP